MGPGAAERQRATAETATFRLMARAGIIKTPGPPGPEGTFNKKVYAGLGPGEVACLRMSTWVL